MSTRGESSETRAVPQIVFRSSQAMLSTRGSSEFSCRDIAIIAQYFPIDFGKLRRANLHAPSNYFFNLIWSPLLEVFLVF